MTVWPGGLRISRFLVLNEKDKVLATEQRRIPL